MSDAIGERIRYRRPWLAALLSLFFSWLGQVYNRQPRKAVAIYLVDVLTFAVIVFAPPRTFPLFAALMAFIVLWRIGVVTDAFLQARKLGAIPLARYNRWWVYVGLLLLASAATLPLNPRRSMQSFSTPADSNYPSLQTGDHFLAFSISARDLQRGEMVVFRHPRNKFDYVRRIVGLPGDKVRMQNGMVFINDIAIPRKEVDVGHPRLTFPQGRGYEEVTPEGKRYTTYDQTSGPLDNIPEQTVPAGHYWVLGDNRDNSLDSRVLTQIGFVPAENIYRKAGFVFWSRNLSRIGKVID